MGIHAKILVASLLLLAPQFVVPGASHAQEEFDARRRKPLDYSRLTPMLGFELRPHGTMPGGWTGGPADTIFVDDQVVHSGRWSVRIERKTESRKNYSTLTKIIPIEFAGETIELRGYLQTEDVEVFTGLWMREDDDSISLGFDNMQSRQVKGTTPWTQYSIKLHLRAEAKRLLFGVLQTGTGKTWADDLELLVDGKPLWEAPKAKRTKTGLEADHEFDGGSRIQITTLSATQIKNLALLGKVWGFLKYYDPTVTEGQRHWDYDLFRVLPDMLKARDPAEANTVLLGWVASLGEVPPCHGCASLNPVGLYFGPDLDWIGQTTLLGNELSARLQNIRDNRLPAKQFYVSKVPGVGNASFEHELPYTDVSLPDSGFQLLSLYRFWNIVEYWSPDRDLASTYWNSVLEEFIPRFALAKDEDSYKRGLFALMTKLRDGHVNLWDSLDIRPPVGKCELPVNVRFAENVPVIAGFRSSNPGDWGALKLGDVITELDGKPVAKLIEGWKAYYSASNDAARMSAIGRYMTRGNCGDTKVAIRRETRKLKLKVERVPSEKLEPPAKTHDLPGPAFRFLSKDVAYLKISTAKAGDAKQYVQESADTKGMIIDIRDYPSDFLVFSLGSLLVQSDTPFARITQGDLANPGAFYWGAPISLPTSQPHYAGKIVVLVDETSVSAAEYAAMAFRAAPNAIVVGSTTAGADGNVSTVTLPGGLHTMISGVGVFYPDETPTQQVGIVPDIEVKPTIAGIRAHRDEVLEEALRQILGAQAPTAEIVKIAMLQP
jgi:C-terminal processing protease CtpA/Prc